MGRRKLKPSEQLKVARSIENRRKLVEARIESLEAAANEYARLAGIRLFALDDMRSALGLLIAIVTKVGGYMSAEDQEVLRNAQRAYGAK